MDPSETLIAQGGQRAVKVASRRSFLRAFEGPVESTLTFAESLGATSTTSSPEAASFWAKGRPMPVAPSIAQRRSAKRLAQRSSALMPHDLLRAWSPDF